MSKYGNTIPELWQASETRKSCRTDGKFHHAAGAGGDWDTGCGWSGCGRCYEY